MKILHLADLHLGKNVAGLSMIDSQRYVLNEAIDLCKEQGIKHIIISGDVYDRSIPPEEAVSLLNSFLSRVILEEHFHVYMISGNHDSRERLSCFNGILEKQGLYIDTGINNDLSMNKHVIKDNDLVINIYSLPYIFPGEIKVLTGDDSIRDFEKSVSKILSSNQVNKDEINIINTHYFVTGKEEPKRSDSEVRTSVGAIEQIPYTLFDDYDYVALGHLHCPQHIGRETVRYAGSPLRYSVDEISQQKCFNVINIHGKNAIFVEKFDIKPLYEFTFAEGTVDELTANSEVQDKRILFFKLTDTKHQLNAAARLKIKYPHYVGLTYVNISDDFYDEQDSLVKNADFENLSTDQQFEKFFQYIAEKEMDDVQKELVQKVIKDLEDEGL